MVQAPWLWPGFPVSASSNKDETGQFYYWQFNERKARHPDKNAGQNTVNDENGSTINRPDLASGDQPCPHPLLLAFLGIRTGHSNPVLSARRAVTSSTLSSEIHSFYEFQAKVLPLGALLPVHNGSPMISENL